MRRTLLALTLCCAPIFAQQAIVTVPGEPSNLDTLKQQLAHYQSCTEADCYGPQLDHQADLALGVRFQ